MAARRSSGLPDLPPFRVPRTGILTPSSDSSVNEGKLAASSDKAKRDLGFLEGLLRTPITVKPYPRNVTAKPCTLQPLMLLPREHLSLEHLDLMAPQGDLPRSKLYSSVIRVLDLESRMALLPSILLARHDSSKHIYAIERVDKGLCTICKLERHAPPSQFINDAVVYDKQLVLEESPKRSEEGPVPLTTAQSHKEHKKKRAAIEALQAAVQKRARSQSVATLHDTSSRALEQTPVLDGPRTPQLSPPSPDIPQGITPTEESGTPVTGEATAHQSSAPPERAVSDAAFQQTADDIFKHIRAQYSEALYRSKGSLAYFAKGPLSRARAAFHLDCDGTLHMHDLLEFLRSLVMTTVQIDKKYREALPEIISKMKTFSMTSDEETKPKKRKAKKMKPGKDGLFPLEDVEIKEWWTANKPDTSSDEEGGDASPVNVKSYLDLLRARETQLQMILIFEILALEPLRMQEEEAESQLPGLSATPDNQKAPKARSAARGKHNLPVMVDVHADRLCIWQSTASDDVRLLETSQGASDALPGPAGPKPSSDPLKDFCTDIIMPFFAARLPDLCDSINRKLGGPVILSPPKPKQVKPASAAKADTKPGAAAKRAAPGAQTSKTIERALYKEQSRRSVSRGPGSTIALMRSATSAAIPGLKRENSDQSLLASMFRTEPPVTAPGGQGPPGLLSRSSSLTSLDDSKAQKKAIVDAELQSAISALRKPNRELAGKAMIEAAERRTSGGLSRTRKTKKPSRHPLFQAVQVKATPANNRFRDVLDSEPRSDGQSSASRAPPSSALFVPATGQRNSTRDFFGVESSAIKATPLRARTGSTVSGGAGPSSCLREGEEMSIPPSSPLMSRKALKRRATATGTTTTTRLDPIRSPSPRAVQSGLDRFTTPVKATSSFRMGPRGSKGEEEVEPEIAATPLGRPAAIPQAPSLPPPAEKKMSIYERLGWDDDYEL